MEDALWKTVPKESPKGTYYLLKTGKDRLAAWEAVRGMWKERDPDPIVWHEASRKEWDRELPSLRR
jgi:hypothetical protein